MSARRRHGWRAPRWLRRWLSGHSILNNIVAAALYGGFWVAIGIVVAHVSEYRETLALIRILGVSSISGDTVVVAYPTIAANAPSGTPDRFRSIVKGLDPPYIMEGPDEVVAEHAVLAVRHILATAGGRLRDADFVPHTAFAEPSLWPEKAIIAIGGPVANEVVFHATATREARPLRFDTTSHPWTVYVHDVLYYSDNRRVLDYGFILRTKHPRGAHYVLSVFGLGSPATEAACHFLLTETERVREILDRDEVLVLKVVNEEVTHPVLMASEQAAEFRVAPTREGTPRD